MKISAISKQFMLLFIFLVSLQYQGLKAQEAVVFDETIDWEWKLPQTYGGNSFYWWHRTEINPDIINYGDMSPTDWKSPYNYYNGTFQIRFEVISQPTSSSFSIQFGIWQDYGKAGGWSETMSPAAYVSGGTGSSVQKSLGTPANWWNIREDAKLDFTRPENFWRIGLVLWKGNQSCIPYAQGWTPTTSTCPNPETEQLKFFPMEARVTIVAVAQGHTFSGWENYPIGGEVKKPTPTYSVDFVNERTNKVVPSTDEYSHSSNMSGAVSGTGAYIPVTPGQDVYFRTKASGDTAASNIQTLDVPSKPAAPTFTYDPVNQRTSTTISNAYEYSTSADMSGATTGNGSYVNLTIGSTLYFRKLATSSAFKSNIQALVATDMPNYTIDYTNERTTTVVASTDQYSFNQTSWTAGTNTYLTLTPGQNVYFRKTASPANVQTLVVPARPFAPTFAWDAANQRTTTTVSNLYEYSSSSNMSGAVSGSGSYVSISAGTTKYFRKKATASAFKSNVQALTGVASTGAAEIVILNDIISWPNTTDPNGFYYFPYNANMPTNWLTPYDFYNGQVYTRFEIINQPTSTPVSLQFGIWQKLPPETGTEYETMGPLNVMSGPGSIVTKNNSPSTWWKLGGADIDWSQMNNVWHFGINVWKNGSQMVTTDYPTVWAERYTYWYPLQIRATVIAVASGHTFSGWDNYIHAGAVPTYEIDYLNERTSTVVPSSDEYSYNQTTWVSGPNANLALQPGTNVYFREKISPTLIQTLTVPARAAAPAVGIDYINERTTASIAADYEYSSDAGMESFIAGTGEPVVVTPGTTMHFRKKATATEFASAVKTLNVPARPATPGIDINFVTETTGVITSDYVYSAQSDMTGATAGTGVGVPLAPGGSLYIQKPATASSFKSAIQHLVAPTRPAAPVVGIDYAFETTDVSLSSGFSIAGNAAMNNAYSGTGSKLQLSPGSNLYIRQKATTTQFSSHILELVVPERPVITVTLPNPVTVTNVPVTISFPNTVTGFTPEDLKVVNGTVASITGNYSANIIPVAVGSVRISLASNVVNEGNFAAFTVSFNYELPTGIDGNESFIFKVYPTLAKDFLTVESPDSPGIKYEIIDGHGAVMSQGIIKERITSIPIDQLGKGSYFIRLNSDKSAQSFWFFKD